MPRIAPIALHILEVATHTYLHHKISIPHLQILYTPMLSPLCNCTTVCKYEFDKSMCSCALIKDDIMRQIINDLYLLFLRIKNLAGFFMNKYFDLFLFKNLRLYPPPPH